MQRHARRASAEVVFWKKGNPTAQGVHITHKCLCTDHKEESTGDRLRRALFWEVYRLQLGKSARQKCREGSMMGHDICIRNVE